MNKNSLWRVQSITKNVSATTVAWLVNNKLTKFDAKVNPSLDLRFASKKATKEISIKNCLSHCTGLPSEAGSIMLAFNYDLNEIYQTVKYQPLVDINTDFRYNNLGFTIGFDAVRTQAGYKCLNSAIEEFTKLIGMKIIINEPVPKENKVIPYLNGLPQKTPVSTPFGPAANIVCTIENLAIFIKFHLNKGDGIIKESVLKQIYKPIIKSDNIADGFEYGMGTAISTFNCNTVYGHSGVYSQGFINQMLYDINNQIGVVVLTNAFNPTGIALAYYIYLALLGDFELADKIFDEYYASVEALIKGVTCVPVNISYFIKDYDLSGKYYIKVGYLSSTKLFINQTNIEFNLITPELDSLSNIDPIYFNNSVIGINLIFQCNTLPYIKIS